MGLNTGAAARRRVPRRKPNQIHGHAGPVPGTEQEAGAYGKKVPGFARVRKSKRASFRVRALPASPEPKQTASGNTGKAPFS